MKYLQCDVVNSYQVYIYETMLEFKQKYNFATWNKMTKGSSAL